MYYVTTSIQYARKWKMKKKSQKIAPVEFWIFWNVNFGAIISAVALAQGTIKNSIVKLT
jgi:hypothetical protein